MTSVPVVNRASLPPAQLTSLEGEIGSLTSLEKVLRWAEARHPPLPVAEILTQDEYTHDVVLPVADDLVLVFDTT